MTDNSATPQLGPSPGNQLPAWLCALLITAPLSITVFFPFDFVDDGCLVYRESPGIAKRVMEKTISEFHTRGPFRPMTWLHWELQAELFDQNAFMHRLARLGLAFLTAWLMMIFFNQMGCSNLPSAVASSILMLTPYRGEIWLSLGLTEAFFLPYCMLSLISTIRASQSHKLTIWDMVSWVSATAAIACKNTSVAIIPALLLLRAWPVGALFQPWNVRGPLCFLASPAVFFIAHLIAFKLDTTPKEYSTSLPGLGHFLAWARALSRASALEFIGPGLLIIVFSIFFARRHPPMGQGIRRIFATSLLLIFFGVGVHIPINGVSGRYSAIPGIGLDLIIGFAIQNSLDSKLSTISKWGLGLVMAGILVALATDLNKGLKQSNRSLLLWEVVGYVENHFDTQSQCQWLAESKPEKNNLGKSEGIHMGWHLKNRGIYQGSFKTCDDWPDTRIGSIVITTRSTHPDGWNLQLTLESSSRMPHFDEKLHIYSVKESKQ